MLNKAIEHKKEYRKSYRGGKAISLRCRNHGGCPWCEENRKYKYKKKEDKFNEMLKEYLTKY